MFETYNFIQYRSWSGAGIMKPVDRCIAALCLEEPDRIPKFELEFQQAEKIVGRPIITGDLYRELLRKGKKNKVLNYNVRVLVELCHKLKYDAIRLYAVPDMVEAVRLAKKLAPDMMVIGSSDGTIGIPSKVEDLFILFKRMRFDKHRLKEECLERIRRAIESSKAQIDAGAEAIVGCADYSTTKGPFMSPENFNEFVFPYLKMHVDAVHRAGAFYIKHTDGDLWPIMNGLVDTGIDGLHSIDPISGMDIGEVKRKVGSKVCLCGNIDVGYILLKASVTEVVAEVKKCVFKASPGGGHILCSSNVIQREHRLENVLAMLKAGEKYGRYPIKGHGF